MMFDAYTSKSLNESVIRAVSMTPKIDPVENRLRDRGWQRDAHPDSVFRAGVKFLKLGNL